MKIKFTGLLLLSLLMVGTASADEGMWPVQHLSGIYAKMRKAGLKLPEKTLYNPADPSAPGLTDAVVAVDGGMGSGSMISHDGLMITNHHVAYSDICALSTPEHNYLETGFWARSQTEELPVAGKTVSFLRQVVDVTDEALAMKAEMQKHGRWGVMSMRRLYADLEKKYEEITPYEVVCAAVWGGRRFYIYYYEVFRDVRLVGAPPVSIGSFGGDVDNWSWPQHKGDFALYRVYGDAEGKPADYAPENRPIHPTRVLEVATRGIYEGDYTMVIGFPGRTNRYLSSYAIRERQEIKNPIVVADRHERMEIIRRNMESSPEVRMKYSDAYFSLSNFADLAKWETICLRRFEVADRRAAEEETLGAWIAADPQRRQEYGSLLPSLAKGYNARREATRALNHFREAWLGPSEALLVANRISSYLNRLDRMKRDVFDIHAQDAAGVLNNENRLRGNYDAATDREIFARMMVRFMEHVPQDMWGEGLVAMYQAAGNDAYRMACEAFDHSICGQADRFAEFFSRNRSVAELRNDPMVQMTESVKISRFTHAVEDAERAAGVEVSKLESQYAQALYDYREAQGLQQYPNANSTMRVTYGKVRRIDPSDGVHCDAHTTVAGYVEKYDPTRYEFRVDERMRSLIAARSWGRWGKNGELSVNFLTDNDITGGNSGSPVLDSRGRLIGLAFDGNRESMACDVHFEAPYARTVCVDIRFVMWVIEQYADAGYLLDEITFVK